MTPLACSVVVTLGLVCGVAGLTAQEEKQKLDALDLRSKPWADAPGFVTLFKHFYPGHAGPITESSITKALIGSRTSDQLYFAAFVLDRLPENARKRMDFGLLARMVSSGSPPVRCLERIVERIPDDVKTAAWARSILQRIVAGAVSDVPKESMADGTAMRWLWHHCLDRLDEDEVTALSQTAAALLPAKPWALLFRRAFRRRAANSHLLLATKVDAKAIGELVRVCLPKEGLDNVDECICEAIIDIVIEQDKHDAALHWFHRRAIAGTLSKLLAQIPIMEDRIGKSRTIDDGVRAT